jgi:secondary thiamine-phosphate synthase enzyme|tara:strand:+ start:345 stop:764 length:420 start_codon:yes stop_codon:yes gene_type:complete
MRQEFFDLELNTNGQSLYELTMQIKKWVIENEFNSGIINISIKHTSASLIIQENADPDVQADLIKFFNKLVPMDNSLYIHTTEGKDDMPAHIKSTLTNNQISLSVKNNELLLGTWQGLYLFEHRIEKQTRLIVLHYLGD